MVHWSIIGFKLSIDLLFAENLVSSPKKKYPAELFDAQFHPKLLVLYSDVAVEGYTLLHGIFLDHLSFLISQYRLLRQLEDLEIIYFFYHNVVLFQMVIKAALYPSYLISHQLNFQGLTKI